jgi:hypothetical protein
MLCLALLCVLVPPCVAKPCLELCLTFAGLVDADPKGALVVQDIGSNNGKMVHLFKACV